MPIIKEITQFLEEFAPLHLQEDYDNAGLIIGDPKKEVEKVIICLDSIEEVVDEAISENAQLIIAHHPIIFKGLKKINNRHYIDKTISKAIKNDISIYAAHTNLDNIYEGVNKKLAEKIGLKDLNILKSKTPSLNIGAGMIGQLQESKTPIEFLNSLKEKLGLNIIRHSSILDLNIEKVAICGGSGSFLTQEAISAGAQAFISADFKYHDFFEANNEIIIIDIGHYESERFTIELFHQVLSGKFPNIALQFSKVNTNPVNYFK